MKKVLTKILARFPGQSNQILDLFENNENFRELCEDYFISAETLVEYKVNEIKNQEFEMHYQHIYQELEKEIRSFLKLP